VVLLEVLNVGYRKVPTSIDTRCATCTAAYIKHERNIIVDLRIRGGNQIASRSCRDGIALTTCFSTSCIKGKNVRELSVNSKRVKSGPG
jgi:hypothetical protein